MLPGTTCRSGRVYVVRSTGDVICRYRTKASESEMEGSIRRVERFGSTHSAMSVNSCDKAAWRGAQLSNYGEATICYSRELLAPVL
jgi:hypothetical protein